MQTARGSEGPTKREHEEQRGETTGNRKTPARRRRYKRGNTRNPGPKKRNVPVCTGTQFLTKKSVPNGHICCQEENEAPQRLKPALKRLDLGHGCSGALRKNISRTSETGGRERSPEGGAALEALFDLQGGAPFETQGKQGMSGGKKARSRPSPGEPAGTFGSKEPECKERTKGTKGRPCMKIARARDALKRAPTGAGETPALQRKGATIRLLPGICEIVPLTFKKKAGV
jgi:hypothetical protein